MWEAVIRKRRCDVLVWASAASNLDLWNGEPTARKSFIVHTPALGSVLLKSSNVLQIHCVGLTISIGPQTSPYEGASQATEPTGSPTSEKSQ